MQIEFEWIKQSYPVFKKDVFEISITNKFCIFCMKYIQMGPNTCDKVAYIDLQKISCLYVSHRQMCIIYEDRQRPCQSCLTIVFKIFHDKYFLHQIIFIIYFEFFFAWCLEIIYYFLISATFYYFYYFRK